MDNIFQFGYNGHLYAVFNNEYEAERNSHRFPDCPFACFGGFLNAIDVTGLIWNI